MEAITVSKLNNYIKQIFDAEELLHNIPVVGEIFGVSISRNVIYFSLKDESSMLSCVCFYPNFLPLLNEGDKVIVTGSPNYYVKGGKLNFNVVKVEKVGQGQLYENFLKLKDTLEKEGLFDSSHKKPLPKKIERIGVITSRDGAVIQDIKNVAWRRNPSVDIVLYPCKVQGNGAEKEIAEGIDFFSNYDKVDAVIVARGGGSLEDLSAYNTEIVARATYNCNKFLVSAVGHEVDFTIIDFVSDLRAPTPSAAAELLTEDRQKEKINYRHILNKLSRQLESYISEKLEEYNDDTAYFLTRYEDYIMDKYEPLKFNANRLSYIIEKLVMQNEHILEVRKRMLDGLNPKRILERGYAKVEQGGEAINDAKSVLENMPLEVNFYDGQVTTSVTKKTIFERK